MSDSNDRNRTGPQLSAALAALVDELLPGKGDWPSGATLGVQHPVMERIAMHGGEAALDELTAALARIGAPFEGLAADARVAAVKKLEAEEPARFRWLRNAAYQAYYENPAIVALIDGRGTPYRLRPHVRGYELPAFDPATQTPTHGRGHWIRTENVRRVDTSSLNLETEITTKWGLQR
ncbi:MAG: hypothetical protein KDH19_20040 [Geminicoccaceae bacterium]|nr:hypothetical protein [Geminicoccaceae bacterium]